MNRSLASDRERADAAALASLDEARPLLSGSGYDRLRRSVVLATAAVAIIPLVIMAVANYYAYSRSLRHEAIETVSHFTTNLKRSLEFFVAERRSALDYVIHDRTFDELCDNRRLARVIRNVNQSFEVGTFVDLGVIGANGVQRCYSGPHDLVGRNYAEQEWFQSVSRRGTYISDVFLGFRNSPHFAIAQRSQLGDSGFYILRATVDSDLLNKQVHPAGAREDDDVFVVNREGVLQTPSKRYGRALERIPLPVPRYTNVVEVLERADENGRPIYLGYGYVQDSPFLVMFIKPAAGLATSGWSSLPARLFGFLAVSVALILAVIAWGARQFVSNIRAANLKRAAMMHTVEYNAKLALIGRLAAGVAHEINNPLAIINEKAGLLKDIVSLEPQSAHREKVLTIVDSVLGSVERCRRITHRLLGFARHMDVSGELIAIPGLLEEVVGFLGKEAEYRNIAITFRADEDVPRIESDRGQLQQVFLNILNNAVAAVKDGGLIQIEIRHVAGRGVAVGIADNGIGIPKENLQRIFEPFFTTKEGSGTGLGLSITYGIVKKLGGDITVESEVGAGTRFTVFLPLRRGG